MQHFTGTRKNLHTALLTFIRIAVRPGSTADRQREWNELVARYGTRIVEGLKDVAHQATQCRVMNAEANRGGAPIDYNEYDRHLIAAKSFAWAICEDW